MTTENAASVSIESQDAASNDAGETSHAHLIFNEGIIIIFVMFLIYMAFEAFKHKKQISFGHEASLVTLIGFGVSYAYQAAGQKEFAEIMQFSDDLFFYLCLPPIVFASGFNMQRKKFFANIRNIVLFGVVGTILAFISFTAMTYIYKEYISSGMTQVNGATGEVTMLDLSATEIIIMSSLLCSTDVIAAVSLIDNTKQPKLFSLVFGEGITNDAVSIILFNTVINYSRKNQKITPAGTFEIALEFGTLGLRSILVGIIVAIIASYCIKKVRALTRSPVSECAMLFCFAYLSYVVAELWHLSGIITLLSASIMMANYAWYNLSPQGKQSSVVIFKFIGFLAECFVFSYLGLTFFSYKTFQWSSELIIVEFFVILIGRGLGTFGLISLLKCCKYEKDNPKKITWKELAFIWYAGLIRGAIAFGLVLRIDDSLPNRGVIVTTCLTLVVFTTIFFGSTVGLLGNCLFKDTTEKEEQQQEAINASQADADDSLGSDTLSQSSESSHVHEPLIHYNEQIDGSVEGSAANAEGDDVFQRIEDGDVKVKTKKKTSCADYFKRFDQLILRPLLIHKYEKDKEARTKEFYEMFHEEGAQLKKLYRKDGHNATHLSQRTGSDQGSNSGNKILRAATITKQRRQSVRKTQSETSVGRDGSIVSGGMIKESINEDRNEDEENN